MSRERVRGAAPYSRKRRRDNRGAAPLELERDAGEPGGAGPFPAARVAELGRSGGETPDGHVTADDLSPETLLDDDPSRSPAVRARRAPQDAQLRRSGSTAGMGDGPDEAEMADRKPVGRKEAAKLERRSQRHANDARYLEPAGAAEALDRKRDDDRH
ncbi:hypothetical protein C3942_08740 [Solimonas fluminis]|uniref:Uncharacterized protein n=1 Tax=Solimonas fluminis TaxID=2086571 RepID=A0A2S5TGK4_9GAMM|nr:hypothetical protein [Solimonas fluminis]PPE74116.1 hypothetical protein C3942_08740 [Solimonas fluminis]